MIAHAARWLAIFGRLGLPGVLLAFNTRVVQPACAGAWEFGYWSLSAFVKTKVKNALQFIENYEQAVADEARRRGVDGVICGHIHKAEMRDIGSVAVHQ